MTSEEMSPYAKAAEMSRRQAMTDDEFAQFCADESAREANARRYPDDEDGE